MKQNADEWLSGLRGILTAAAALPMFEGQSKELGRYLDTATELVLHDVIENRAVAPDAILALNEVADRIYALGRDFLEATK